MILNKIAKDNFVKPFDFMWLTGILHMQESVQISWENSSQYGIFLENLLNHSLLISLLCQELEIMKATITIQLILLDMFYPDHMKVKLISGSLLITVNFILFISLHSMIFPREANNTNFYRMI